MNRLTRTWAATAVAGALLLAGCGGDDQTNADGTGAGSACPVDAFKTVDGKTEIVLWYQLSGKAGDNVKSGVDKYNASQDKVTLRAENQGSSYEELFAAYQRGIPTNQLPDILIGEETTLRYLVDSDTLMPAQDCFDKEGIKTDQFNRQAVTHYTVDGKLYPGSASISDILTYYNKNHFRKANLPADRPPKTLTEVRAMAEQIKAAGVVDTPVVMKMDSWMVETQLTGDRLPVVDNENGRGPDKTTKALFNNETTTALFTWIRDMVRDGLMTAVPATDGQFDHYLRMAGQKASISMETSTAATSIAAFLRGDQGVGDNLGVNPSAIDLNKLDFGAGPVFGIKDAGRAQIGGNAYFMTKVNGDAKISASWDFIKFWNQPEQQVQLHLEGSYLPFLTAAVDDPRIQTFWSSDIAGRFLKIAYDEMRDGIYPDFTGPVIGPMAEFRNAMKAGLDSVAFSNGDPAQAVQTAAAEVDQALTTYNETSGK